MLIDWIQIAGKSEKKKQKTKKNATSFVLFSLFLSNYLAARQPMHPIPGISPHAFHLF